MRKTTKVIVGSAMTMALCTSLITGATLALFTGEDNVNIAVTSGKVDVQASVTNLWTYSNAVDNVDLDKIEDWTPGTGSGTTLKGNFTPGGTATYSVDGGTGTLTLNTIAPGDAVKFTLYIANNSNISIKYQIRMLTTNDDYVGTPPDLNPDTKLSSALEVKIGSEETKTGLAYAYSPYTPWSNAEGSIGTDIIIRLPKDTGNAYEARSCSIDLTVRAIQSNARETSYCQEVGKHVYGEDNCLYCGEPNPYKSHHNEAGDTYTINGVDSGVSELYIPSEINGKAVKLGSSAFNGNTTLERVTIEDGITEIPANCFYDCTNLKEFDLPESVTAVGNSAFWKCPIESLDLSHLTSIGEWGFTNSWLKEVNLGAGLEKLGSYAFNGCSKLERVEFAEGIKLTSIPNSTFNGCSALVEIQLPETVTSIGEYAFQACSSLKSINLDNITSVGQSAFGEVSGEGCTSLQSVSLPKVTKIGQNAFRNCTALTTVSLATETGNAKLTIDYWAFFGCSALSELTFGTPNIELLLNGLNAGTFNDCINLHTIHFAGTTSAWTTLEGTWGNWILNTTIAPYQKIEYTVDCTDGMVNEKGEVTPKA